MTGRKKPRLVAERRYKPKSTKPKTPAKSKAPARKRRARKTSPRRRGILGWILAPFVFLFRMIWAFVWRVGAVAALVLAVAVFYTYAQLPELNELLDGRAKGSVTLLDRRGVVFAWRGDQFGGAIGANTVAPVLKNAVIATEDKRFYRHLGISPRGIASAVRINMREGRKPWQGHGGSTITQQTAKLLCLGVPFDPEKWKSETEYERDCRRTTLARKAKEAIFAFAMEAKFTKDEILSIYLNRAFLGAGARGFEAASQVYFGKSAAAVTLPEAAMLAGLLKAPSRYAPTSSLKRARARAETVLKLMREQGYISIAEEAAARENPASLSKVAQERAGGYFVDWVMSTGPDFLTHDTTEDVVIQTTFDKRIQRAAEAAMETIFKTKVKASSKAEAAIVVMSADGAVRAMVGGRKTKVSGAFNRAAQAKRQTGSAFKPFVYAAALEQGFRYDSVVEDAPLCLTIRGSGQWCPKNYTNDYRGRMTLTDALKDSINTVAVKVSEEVGRDNVRRVAERFGIVSDLANGPALALGSSESSLLEMTGAYAGILNGGRAVAPYGLVELRLKGDSTPLMGKSGGFGERVISQSASEQLVYMMSRVISDGTGRRAQLKGREAAGKTGTTQAARDAWFIGFTAQYVVGVWMGNDDNTPLRGVTGGGLPADIWRETMVRVSDGVPAAPLPMIRPRVAPKVQGQGGVATGPSAPGANQGTARNTQQRQQRTIENVIINILGDLLGGN